MVKLLDTDHFAVLEYTQLLHLLPINSSDDCQRQNVPRLIG